MSYGKQGNGDFSLDSDSEGEEDLLEDDENPTAMNIKTSFIMEKSAAITAVG